MTRAGAGKLVGGHATGTLTEAERRALYEAALEDQALFDTLMDEEALRELLADPEARARTLAALAQAPPKVVPFWRRPGVIGAAAGILMAATAGLVVLRSPEALPPATRPEAAPAAPATAAPKALVVPPLESKAKAERIPRRTPAEAPAERPAEAVAEKPAPPVPDAEAFATAAAQKQMQAEARQRVVRDQVSRQAEAAGLNRAGVRIGGGGVPAPAPPAAAMAAAPRPAPPVPAPVWIMDPQPDGSTLVSVGAAREAAVALLRRGRSGVAAVEPLDGPGPWRFRVRLEPGDVLDLYVLDIPVADPARLPETGPVDGFRARIHPAAKKSPLP